MAIDEANQPEVTEEAPVEKANGVEAMEHDAKPEEVDLDLDSKEEKIEEQNESKEEKVEEKNESKEEEMEEQTESKETEKRDEEKKEERKDVQAQVIVGEKRARKPSFKFLANEDFVSPFAEHRPVRERKTVARLVASPEVESPKIHIPKGHGTALKDIPRVANKLARKKNEETLKMLHGLLFGRQAKAPQLKNNLSQFSGFEWHENEEKQRSKMKEKLDKFASEKLFEFCDVFDIPIVKATAKKEEVVTQLLDFLAAPHPASNVLHTEDGKSSTTKKRSRTPKNILPESGDGASKPVPKKQKKIEEGNKVMEDSDSESDASQKSGSHNELQEEEKDKTEKVVHDGSEDLAADNSETKEMEHDSGVKSDQESKKVNQSSKRSSAKISLAEGKPKKVTVASEETPPKKTMKSTPDDVERVKDKETEKSVDNDHEEDVHDHFGSKKEEHDSRKKSTEITKKQKQSSISSLAKTASPVKSKQKKGITVNETPLKSPKKTPGQKHSKVDDGSEKNAIVFSRKKKNQAPSSKKSITPKSIEKEKDNKEQAGKKSLAANEEQMDEACSPTEQELRKAIGEILREVDLNKITFLDILKQLGQTFNVDLVPRKSAIKVMVKDELIKLNDEDDEEEEEDEDDESDNEKVVSPEVPEPKVKQANSTPGSAGNTTESEGRCIRSDGRKWRCSKDVMPGTKYCEHHLNRVRKR